MPPGRLKRTLQTLGGHPDGGQGLLCFCFFLKDTNPNPVLFVHYILHRGRGGAGGGVTHGFCCRIQMRTSYATPSLFSPGGIGPVPLAWLLCACRPVCGPVCVRVCVCQPMFSTQRHRDTANQRHTLVLMPAPQTSALHIQHQSEVLVSTYVPRE